MIARKALNLACPVAVLVIGVATGAGCRRVAGENDAVDVTYAASLTVAMANVASRFREQTGREVRGDPRGSVAGAHLIREGVWRPDVYITADPATLPLLGDHDPGWAIVFARGELVLGYGDESRHLAALDSAKAGLLPWADVVLRPGFRLGRTDPDLDPKGYRAIFAFRLAEELYGRRGLAARILSGPSGERNVFPEEHLSARVLTGSLDAAVFYLAEASQQGLRHVPLPRPLNQGDPADAAVLAGLKYRTSDGRLFRAAPIAYAATIPLNSPDPRAGAELIAFLVGEDGSAVLEESGFVTGGTVLGHVSRVPAFLSDVVAAGDVADGRVRRSPRAAPVDTTPGPSGPTGSPPW